MLRGSIVEYIPGDHVLILLPNGEQRTIPAAELEFAGSARSEEPAPAPAAPSLPAAPEAQGAGVVARPDVPVVPIEVRNVGKGPVLIHVRNPTGMFEQICVVPCKAAIRRGTYKMALSRPDGKPVPDKGLITLREPSVLEGKYSSASGVRGLGWTLLAIGAGVLTAAPFVARSEGSSEADTDVLAGMLIGGALGVGLGIALGLTRDRAAITLHESGPPLRGPPRDSGFRGVPLGASGAFTF